MLVPVRYSRSNGTSSSVDIPPHWIPRYIHPCRHNPWTYLSRHTHPSLDIPPPLGHTHLKTYPPPSGHTWWPSLETYPALASNTLWPSLETSLPMPVSDIWWSSLETYLSSHLMNRLTLPPTSLAGGNKTNKHSSRVPNAHLPTAQWPRDITTYGDGRAREVGSRTVRSEASWVIVTWEPLPPFG